jgi:hypothetical protein
MQGPILVEWCGVIGQETLELLLSHMAQCIFQQLNSKNICVPLFLCWLSVAFSLGKSWEKRVPRKQRSPGEVDALNKRAE